MLVLMLEVQNGCNGDVKSKLIWTPQHNLQTKGVRMHYYEILQSDWYILGVSYYSMHL